MTSIDGPHVPAAARPAGVLAKSAAAILAAAVCALLASVVRWDAGRQDVSAEVSRNGLGSIDSRADDAPDTPADSSATRPQTTAADDAGRTGSATDPGGVPGTSDSAVTPPVTAPTESAPPEINRPTPPTTPPTTPAPTTPPTPPPTLPPPAMPIEAELGPAPEAPLQPIDPSMVVIGGTNSGVQVLGKVEIGPGQAPTTFTNCRIEDSIVTWSPVNLSSCVVTGGVYAYDTGGAIDRSLLLGTGQAFRPGTENTIDAYTLPTPWIVTNTIMRIGQGVPPAHVEASQVLGGNGMVFRNVVFDSGGPFNNTQTADLNFMGANLLCEDCWFIGFGGYSLYSEGPNNVFVRPRFGRNAAFGLIYPSVSDDLAPVIIEPYYTDGEPIDP